MIIPIRIRLTVWYVLLLALTLGVFAGAVFKFLERQQRISVDRVLRERASTFIRSYASEALEERSEKAVIESAREFVRGDAEIFVYASPARLVTRSPVHLLPFDPATIPSVRQSIANAFRGQTATVHAMRGVRAIVAPIDQRFVLVATESVISEQQTLDRVRDAFALAIPAALLIASAGGYFLARRSLAPVAKIAEMASRIEAESLSERIAVRHTGDEFDRLVVVLNALFDRLERSFAQQRQLLADTSHELRTPVTIIRSEAEVALTRERTAGEYRKALETVRSESAHLTDLIERVMILARADAHQIHIVHEPFALAEVIEESIRAAETLARARGIDLHSRIDGILSMRGDAKLLRRMLLNLLDNAIKFSDRGGRVALNAQRAGPNLVITVSDTGPGISSADQPRIFDRFFRGDPVRSRDDQRDGASGTGLGLSIVKWIAEAHQGQVRLLQSTPAGSVFEVVLPGEPGGRRST